MCWVCNNSTNQAACCLVVKAIAIGAESMGFHSGPIPSELCRHHFDVSSKPQVILVIIRAGHSTNSFAKSAIAKFELRLRQNFLPFAKFALRLNFFSLFAQFELRKIFTICAALAAAFYRLCNLHHLLLHQFELFLSIMLYFIA